LIENEIWKTYPEFDWIKASSLGRYRTITREVLRKNGWKYTIKGANFEATAHERWLYAIAVQRER